MALLFKTKIGKYKDIENNQPSPQNRQRVYFCCHQDDFNLYFDDITNEILEKQPNVAIFFYFGDELYNEEERRFIFDQMVLFVIPVTHKFIADDNIPARKDFDFADKNNIPLLLLQQEDYIENFFNEKIGSFQLLYKEQSNEKNSNYYDSTALTYDHKLSLFLDTVIIKDQVAEKIRQAFDAYVFLSYRKKDRKHANQLMRLIHSNPVCRDIAIWYDEFLVPGENFNTAIQEAIEKSDLFTMVVTPNLINEKNYVNTTEYPMACDYGKPIFPAESLPTDKVELKRQYKDVPNPVSTNDINFSEEFSKAVHRIAVRENPKDPKHNYLIGLAYLYGIDVEINRDRAFELIWEAAHNEYPDAILKIGSLIAHGSYPKILDKIDSNGLILPERHVFSKNSPPDYVTFNSFYEENQLDERRFVEIADAGADYIYDYTEPDPDLHFCGNMEIVPGRNYVVRIKINNNANPELNFSKGSPGLAVDVRIKSAFSYSLNSKKAGFITACVHSSNSKPQCVLSAVKLTTKSDNEVYLNFAQASIIMHNNGKLNNERLSTRLLDDYDLTERDGLYIGVNELNGYLPAGDSFSQSITYFLRAEQAVAKVSAAVSLNGVDFYKNISAAPGDIITFKIEYENSGNIDLYSVCRSIVPECFKLVPGTTILTNNCNRSGIKMSDTITKNGFGMGIYGSKSKATIVFKAEIDDTFIDFDSETQQKKSECKAFIYYRFTPHNSGLESSLEKEEKYGEVNDSVIIEIRNKKLS